MFVIIKVIGIIKVILIWIVNSIHLNSIEIKFNWIYYLVIEIFNSIWQITVWNDRNQRKKKIIFLLVNNMLTYYHMFDLKSIYLNN